MKPDFICIGAIKSGTTWLHHNLQQHPEIWLPPIKELRYFNEPEYNLMGRLFGRDQKRYEYWRMQVRFFWQDKRAWLRPGYLSWYLNYFFMPRSPQWYSSLFNWGQVKITGDITPLYATMPESNIAALQKNFPDIKIIYILRSPVERTWSHILLRCISLVNWQPQNLTAEIVRKTVFERDLQDKWLFANGQYIKNLEIWERYFSPEQMLIEFYDDLKREPKLFLKRIYQFLGVDDMDFYQADTLATQFNQKPIQLPIPSDIEAIFSTYYLEELEKLEHRFGGVTTSWLERSRALLEKENSSCQIEGQ